MAEIKLSQARTLCNAAELQLVKSSTKPSLAKLSEPQLKKKLEQARNLRDKWRDVATRQRRDSQRKQNARTTDENAHSAEKGELFAEVLGRFEAQLAKVASQQAGPSSPRIASTPKKKRTQAHRKTRSAVRDELETNRKKLNSDVAPGKMKTAKKKSTKKAAATKPAAIKKGAKKKAAAAQPAAPKKKGAKKKAKGASSKAGIPPAPSPADATDRLQQIQAIAETKRAKVKVSGLDSRIRGHVSARGRRAQAKRDSR